MRNTAIVLLIVSVGVLSLLLYSQNAALREQRRHVQELNAKLDSMSKTASLDLQEKCAKQAREAFRFHGLEKEQMADFANHYNQKLNKCFVEVRNTDAKLMPGEIWTFRIISDAFEGKVYAEYHWRTHKGKKYWEVPPVVCKVTLVSGEERICHSSDEFDALVKQYME
jgi:hypothetical protein